MKKTNAFTKCLFLVLFVTLIGSANVFAYLEEQSVSFQFNGKEHRIAVSLSQTSTDILMTTTGEESKNLSVSFLQLLER